MWKRLEAMHRPYRSLCPDAMLAGQCLTGKLGQHLHSPLPYQW